LSKLELKSLNIYQKLKKLEKKEFGKNSKPISTDIENLIKVSEDILSRVSNYMPEYTLHNIQHSFKILEIIDKIIPENVELNIVELQILIYSAVLHDIGMVIEKDEIEKLKNSKDFKNLTYEFDKNTDENEILTELIRKNHIKRSCEYIDEFKSNVTAYKARFEFNNIDISEYIKNVILSHGNSVSDLKNSKNYPIDKLIDKYYINIQYLSILLRLGDILDFDIFRTPYSLYKHINIKNNISNEEWQKHLSVIGADITDSKISFELKPPSIKIHRKVEEFLDWIETERYESLKLLEENKNKDKYFLNLKDKVDSRITPDGYIYNNLEINLDYEKVINILMGTELYEKPDVFLRELLQNSYDACFYRAELESRKEPDDFSVPYNPKIVITYDRDSRVLEIKDNGIGIDKTTFENFVIKIGKSYYQSSYFAREETDFKPISKFGIGILSSFMVSNTIQIESKKENEDPINFAMNIKDRYIEEHQTTIQNIGTNIKLILNDDFAKNLEKKELQEHIKEHLCCFPIPITIKESNKSKVILNEEKIEISDDIKNNTDVELIEFSKDIDGIDGYFMLLEHNKATTQDLGTGSGKIYQQNFLVTTKQSINLAPIFIHTNAYNFKLNITDSLKLSLRASRNSIKDDQAVERVKKIVINKVIKYIQDKKLDLNKYLDSLYLFNFKGEFDFIKEQQLFIVFEKIDNQYLERNLLSLQNIYNNLEEETKVAIVNYLYGSNIISAIFNKDYQYIILELREPFYLLSPLAKDFKIVVDENIEGLIYTSMTLTKNKEFSFEKFKKDISYNSNLNKNRIDTIDQKYIMSLINWTAK